jgi:hypothetical protein
VSTITNLEVDRWSLVVAAGLAIFMAQLDTTIVLVALPAIAEDLDLSRGAAQWVMLGYLVPLIALSLRAGRWVDRVGLRPALTLAITIFAVASVARRWHRAPPGWSGPRRKGGGRCAPAGRCAGAGRDCRPDRRTGAGPRRGRDAGTRSGA